MKDETVATAEKTIGDTVFIVESEISDSAKETVYEKVKRLILQDTEIYHKKAS